MTTTEAEQVLTDLAVGDGPVLATLAEMNLDTLEYSALDERTYLLVRLAALVAMDAPPISYLANLEVAEQIGISFDEVRGVLAAVAPVVGSARVVSAAAHALAALRAAAD